MSGLSSLLDYSRKLIAIRGPQGSRGSRRDRPSPWAGHLALEELEDRALLTLLGQQLFPADYPWNQNISAAPVATNSAAIISHIGGSIGIHPDWGEDSPSNGDSPLYGIPYNVVHGNSTAKVNVIIDNYPGESDIVPVPIPANAVIEGDYQNGPNPNGGGYNSGQRGDSHLLVWDEDTDTAYELYGVTRPSDSMLFPNTDGVEEPHTDGQWHAAQESVWHMTADQFRALGDTSADAAGLSILAGLARPDEGLPTADGGQGAIDHALRFTLPSGDVSGQYIYPASHVVNESDTSTRLPLGSRLRLENTPAIDAQIANMGPEAQIVAKAMQQYGLVLADIGSAMYVTGTSASEDANNNIDLTWDMGDIGDLHGLTASDFQVVNLTPVVSSLSASSGSVGNTITINGANFSGSAGHLSVFFGTTPATNVTYISDSQISATVPSGTGTVNVTVQSGVNETDPNDPSDNVNAPIFGYGTSATSAADDFTFSSSTVSGTNSSAAFSSSTVTAGATDTLTIVVKDGSGNAVTGLANSAFQLSLSGGTSAGNFGTVSESATKGTYTTTFTASTAGTASSATVVVNSVTLSNHPGVTVVVPAKVTGIFVEGSSWQSSFKSYLANNALGSSTYGFALQTGSNQTGAALPWNNVNTITVTFNETLASLNQNSLLLTGITTGGYAVPSVTGFQSLGSNTYQWTLSGALSVNRYLISFKSASVIDAQGAGLDGEWTTGVTTFATGSGNGLAGGDFNFYFNTLPGDANRDNAVSTRDSALIAAELNVRTTQTSYNPYYDLTGAGGLSTSDTASVGSHLNDRLPSSSPAPQVVSFDGSSLTQLALAAQENVSATSAAGSSTVPPGRPALASAFNDSSAAEGSENTVAESSDIGSEPLPSSTNSGTAQTGRRQASDKAVSEFDWVDLYV